MTTGGSWTLVVRDALRRWSKARCASRAAALAFYAVFSLAPILVIVVAVGSIVVDATAVRDSLLRQIGALVGVDGVRVVTAMLDSAGARPRGWYALFAAGVLLVSATTAFAELKEALDALLGTGSRAEGSLLRILCTRLLSFLLVLALALLLLLAIAANAVMRAGATLASAEFGWERLPLWSAASDAVSVAGAFVLFAAIFKLLPARPLGRRAALGAAALTAGLFTAGHIALGVYLSHSAVSLAFGPAGSLAIVLLWIYYASLSFLASAAVVAAVNEPERHRELVAPPPATLPDAA